jgi:predicted DNA-binding protein (MmcQ/YjbR family)/ADP-ribose pyrophosphatase YjhB (NUDIX family)
LGQAAFGIAIDVDRVLLVKLPPRARFGGHWTLPGGFLESGETTKHGVVREILEETGLDFTIERSIWRGQDEVNGHEVEIFMGEATGDLKIQRSELDDAGWFSLAEALKLPLAYDTKRHLEGVLLQSAETLSVIDYILAKPGAVEDYPFDTETAVFKVGGKMFALVPVDGKSVNLKCDPIRSRLLRQEHPEITPGYHMNKEHWNTVSLAGKLGDDLIHELIDHSYQLIASKTIGRNTLNR